MEYIYATLLLHKLGKQVTEEHLKKVIEATGTQADEARIKSLLASLNGVDIDKAMAETAMMAAAPAIGGTSAPKAEEKKEEKKAEEAAEGLSALFG
jgi:large subunit ribosomal protein L12